MRRSLMYDTTCHALTWLAWGTPKASRYSGRGGRLAGREEGLWAGREELAGKRALGEDGWCNARKDVPCLMPLHCMLPYILYIPYTQPLDAQFGVGFKKFGSWPQNLAERRADKIWNCTWFCFLAPFAIASRIIRQENSFLLIIMTGPLWTTEPRIRRTTTAARGIITGHHQ